MTSVARRHVTEMETYTGRYVDLLNPLPEQISLADIAVGLSVCCRFGNQVSRFYSVAEHSVRCAREVTEFPVGALLHDAHEAYTCDITAPMKRTLELVAPNALSDLQRRLDVAIARALNVNVHQFSAAEVKRVDDLIMFREAAGLKYSHGIGAHWGNQEYYEPLTDFGWSPPEAERRFLEVYRELTS